jgi:hypothetical protein
VEAMVITCRVCKQGIETEITMDMIYDWKSSGKLIQTVMPNIPADIRELLLSGTCGSCWNQIFKPEEEEV